MLTQRSKSAFRPKRSLGAGKAAAQGLLVEAGLTDEDIERAINIVFQAIARRGYCVQEDPIILIADKPGVFRGVTFMIQTPLSGNEFLDLAQEIVTNEENDPLLRKHPLCEVVILPSVAKSSAR